jgi:quercetin dioxygenase-like cupin family protein
MRASIAPLCAALCFAAAPAAAQIQTSPMPPQGGPGIYRDGEALASVLAAAAKASPGLGISPVLVTERYSVLEVRRGAAGPPAAHPGWTELHLILDGAGEMLTGGKIVGGKIVGGTAQKIKKGDAVVLPPDTPHQYVQVGSGVTTLEVRFPDPTLVKP